VLAPVKQFQDMRISNMNQAKKKKKTENTLNLAKYSAHLSASVEPFRTDELTGVSIKEIFSMRPWHTTIGISTL